MNGVEAAWVREHAWTRAMRRTHRHCPAIYDFLDQYPTPGGEQ